MGHAWGVESKGSCQIQHIGVEVKEPPLGLSLEGLGPFKNERCVGEQGEAMEDDWRAPKVVGGLQSNN